MFVKSTNPSFYSIEKDGLTQGSLATFLECRQKARWYLQGWSPKGSSMALTYGNIVHAVLEYAYEDVRQEKITSLPSKEQVKGYLRRVEKLWSKENLNPDAKTLQYLELSMLIAEATLPTYFDYWHKDVKEIPWQKLEQEFKIPYTIITHPQNGTTTEVGVKTFLRGKMDGVFSRKSQWLFETKTKSRIEEGDLVDILPFEHQVNFYLYCLRKMNKTVPAGVLYNIVRRVQLQQKETESIKAFAKRCSEDIIKRPDFYFIRLEVKIAEQEQNAYAGELEDMIRDFYLWWTGQSGHYKNTAACLNKYGRCNYLQACSSGKATGYEKRKQVYRELGEDL